MMLLTDLLNSDKAHNILIDADDTLWKDAQFFRGLEDCLCRCIARANSAISPSVVLEVLERNVSQSNHDGEAGFCAAVVLTAKEFAISASEFAGLQFRIQKFKDRVPELFQGVPEGINLLSDRNLILYTKGIPEEQIHKLEQSGLHSSFDDIVIVKKKNAETLRQEIKRKQLDSLHTIMIGNSLKHDILPAVENQIAAVWFNHFENERGQNAQSPDNVIEVKGWAEIIRALRPDGSW